MGRDADAGDEGSAKSPERDGGAKAFRPELRVQGMLLAFGGSLGQAGGLVLAYLGVADGYDLFSATQIRTVAGIAGFALLFFIQRQRRPTFTALRHGWAMKRIATGAFFGPFLGVSLGLLAAQLSSTGVASTIMATVPVRIIAPSVLLLEIENS